MKGFFKPAKYWEGSAKLGLFGFGHIAVIVLMAIAIALIIIFRKKLKLDYIKKYLIVMFIFWTSLEVFKLIIYIAVSKDTLQAMREFLPLYMCSLYLYSLPLAIFGKGKLKQIGEYTLVTLCLLSGLITTVNCPALFSYPMFRSFYSTHSAIYHAFMSVTGVLLIASGYVKLELKRFYYPLILTAVVAVPAIIVNNLVNADYMLMKNAWGAPILQDIAKKIGQPLQIVLMLIIYTLMSLIMTALVCKVFNPKTQAKTEKV